MRKSSESLVDFGHKLVSWYELHKRPLPWRETSDPYRILVSETMLQQTRVETVIPYYHRFLRRYPDIRALAEADEADVMKLWQGLGYYSRARNLQRAMQTVVSDHGGIIPQDTKQVQALPGVGPYTTGAVMSIAYNQPVAAVDGNVLRVMSRYLGIADPIDDKHVKADITNHVQTAVEHSVPKLFTQALMELGATVCTPRRPQCLVCPVQDECTARSTGQVDELPRKRPKKKRKQRVIVALWVEQNGELVVEQRGSDGLLAGMWQLPHVELGVDEATPQAMLAAAESRLDQLFPGNGIKVANEVREGTDGLLQFAQIAEAKHIFTHLEWRVCVMRPVGYHDIKSGQGDLQGAEFVPIHDLQRLVWPKVYEKILHEILGVDVATRDLVTR
ncbi:A/G-specific adenine glycosylase [Alicyclobacillus dauci]|uniref:Adenine DNA glycosylase n=1 Tax=Alicyclobacillus dauci TaxID=1475485 RepID=A0ABY6Z3N0_9BACL|nr:A/G-specific adenine glycosylase [Alicyclobacillus dauci]WAH36590.1 A/G-specific adenine glycosylase [Alicyclobacillus dauci]